MLFFKKEIYANFQFEHYNMFVFLNFVCPLKHKKNALKRSIIRPNFFFQQWPGCSNGPEILYHQKTLNAGVGIQTGVWTKKNEIYRNTLALHNTLLAVLLYSKLQDEFKKVSHFKNHVSFLLLVMKFGKKNKHSTLKLRHLQGNYFFH